jgi:UDP-glucose 4-epimerase
MDPMGYGSVIARFVTQARAGEALSVHGDGEQTRCFTYIDEAVEATLRAGRTDAALGRVYNVGSRFEHSINALAETVLRVTDSSASIAHIPYAQAYGEGFADTRRRVPSVERIARELGWRAEMSLEEGLAAVVAERETTEGSNPT